MRVRARRRSRENTPLPLLLSLSLSFSFSLPSFHVLLSSLACMRAVASSDSASARILPAEFKGGLAIVFGKDQCDRFAGLPHGKPGLGSLLSPSCIICFAKPKEVHPLSQAFSSSPLSVTSLSRSVSLGPCFHLCVLCPFRAQLLSFSFLLFLFFFLLTPPLLVSSRRLARSGQEKW